ADRNRSHWSTSKTPSYTKSVSWQHHPISFWISSLFIYHFGRVIILCTINSNVAMHIYLAVN
ncbi:hypothetical protein, partial [Escherichia coli]|uniref:hypothetical protein n=1 Tax=Escherichia coli TaxID=562 RepID=UPI001BC83A8E